MAEKLMCRTVSENIYDVMVLNIKTKEVRTVSVNLGSMSFKDDSKALDYIRSAKDNDTVKAVMIERKTTADKLYVMKESDFIRYAVAVKDMKEARAYFKKTQGVEIEEEENA